MRGKGGRDLGWAVGIVPLNPLASPCVYFNMGEIYLQYTRVYE